MNCISCELNGFWFIQYTSYFSFFVELDILLYAMAYHVFPFPYECDNFHNRTLNAVALYLWVVLVVFVLNKDASSKDSSN
mmetsp:Transcript_47535/g.53184  ORF Transcript_47535/g.53184 Transcript_47535/m.53184 type:complete len:80 (-) Transcript_47535:17-256(-)